jgi:protein gp37
MNGWRGCSKVSEGCRNCYAEARSIRDRGKFGQWGPNGTRIVAAEGTWREPFKWNRNAELAGMPRRVFSASLADNFEDWKGPMHDHNGNRLFASDDGDWWTIRTNDAPLTMDGVRTRLFDTIVQTPYLNWLLLTKRPENIRRLWPMPWYRDWPELWNNVWIGVSVENQDVTERIHELAKIPAVVRFLSVEPLLGPIDLRPWLGVKCSRCEGRHSKKNCASCGGGGWKSKPEIDWCIIGGESGTGARDCSVTWIRDIITQCRQAGVPVFNKQLGKRPIGPPRVPLIMANDANAGAEVPWVLADRKKGGDMSEWPIDLQVRESQHREPHKDQAR